ncbi:thermonuclease family protein [Paramicrobacterium chengjingii]|uniref:Thermonuclease family protein n=1 Tax=Paramicrobacterium chengjingii TaxID=2769067 RepID=A0ABX6YLK1_9MICO|nr:thermonuclease family protein [Microbacterium chengjingii]QPZ39212.1 thermonuclease family protein [Microbacterium chengjingii]
MSSCFRSTIVVALMCVGLMGCSASVSGGDAATPDGIPDGAERATVAHVHDGDTLFLQPEGTHDRDEQIKVRLLGIDTPELDPEECYGVDARDELRSILPDGSAVWTLADAEPFDQYGRSLLYLWTDEGEFVNEALVAEGYARVLIYEPNTRFETKLRMSEADAENADSGLWSACA